jgi:hypothetical protein
MCDYALSFQRTSKDTTINLGMYMARQTQQLSGLHEDVAAVEDHYM